MLIKNIIEQLLGTLDAEQIDNDNYVISGKYKLHIIRRKEALYGFSLCKFFENGVR